MSHAKQEEGSKKQEIKFIKASYQDPKALATAIERLCALLKLDTS
jgi:hypothetical protein